MVKTNPNKANSKPISFSPQHCWGLKGYLKKQSQFSPAQNIANSYMKGDYVEFHALRRRKNKANSKPILIVRCGQQPRP